MAATNKCGRKESIFDWELLKSTKGFSAGKREELTLEYRILQCNNVIMVPFFFTVSLIEYPEKEQQRKEVDLFFLVVSKGITRYYSRP